MSQAEKVEDEAFDAAYSEYDKWAFSHAAYEEAIDIALRSRNVGRAMWNAGCKFTKEQERRHWDSIVLGPNEHD